jgi:hypothetical protein
MYHFSYSVTDGLTDVPWLTDQLSQRSRRHLSWDSERLAAAASLWQHQNARLR